MDSIFRYERVLIVDDSHIDRFITEKLIRQLYFAREIIQMPSARLALDYLRILKDEESQPDMIFLDINMPDLDGFDFLKEYETLPEFVKRQNIVMLSSSINQMEIDKATANPYVVTFIGKPLTLGTLQML